MLYLAAHRKAIISAIGAVLVIFLDADTAKEISAVVATILLLIVPNDPDAIKAVYHQT